LQARQVKLYLHPPRGKMPLASTILKHRARRGEITGFTGIDDPYEPPLNPEIILETVREGVKGNAQKIMAYLEDRCFFAKNPS